MSAFSAPAPVHPPWLIPFAKSLGATVHLIAVILASGAVTIAVLRVPLPVANPLLLALGILVVAAAGTALGMLLSCLFLLTRHGGAWSSALMFPVFMLGDMLIPADLLPHAAASARDADPDELGTKLSAVELPSAELPRPT
jgi:ABC-2 type transport system permease protein